jgi:hypothetical protein
LYHENVKIPDRLKKKIWKENRVEMKAQIGADVVPIFVAHIQSILHQNNIGVTYASSPHFKMELAIFMPLYSMAMP